MRLNHFVLKVAKFPRVFWKKPFKTAQIEPTFEHKLLWIRTRQYLHCSHRQNINRSPNAGRIDKKTVLQKYRLCKNKSKFVVQRSTYHIQCFARKQNKQLSPAFKRFLIFFPILFPPFAELFLNLSIWSFLE